MAESNPFLLVIPSSITSGGGFLRDFQCIRTSLPLHEYQLYAVEQWVVDRAKQVPIIVVSTNDSSHKILVDVWTPRADTIEEKVAIWDKAITMVGSDGARPKQTNLGYVLVVSLLGFRSDLSIVLVPDGDYSAAKENLYTNINLRRLGCGGRSGLTLSEASPSQQERFLQQYRLPSASTSGPNFTQAVLRTIQLVQAGLALFDKGPVASTSKELQEPDGLLCEQTISSIGRWKIDVGFPLLGGEAFQIGDSVLSSSVLTALLTVVIAVRCRLLTMGVHHVPSDPFVDRTQFLRCYSTFMKTTRHAPESEVLTAEGIIHLRQQYTRTTKDFLKRAIRHRIDDIRGEGLSSGISKSAILEEETTDINAFVAAIQSNGSGDIQSVVNLWKGKIKKDRGYGRRSDPFQGDDTTVNLGGSGTESDDEAGFGKLLKGVSKRTRKIGDGVTGLLDKTGVRSGQPERDETHRSRHHHHHHHHHHNSHRWPNDTSSSNAQGQDQNENGLYRVSPFVSHASISTSTSPAGSHRDLLGVPGLEPQSPSGRPAHMRRSITDQGQSRSEVEGSFKSVQLAPRRRRHSLSCLRELPSSLQIMSVRRMRADVELYTGYHELRSREAYFAKLVLALTEIDKAYDICLGKLGPAIQRRQNEVEALSHKARDLGSRIESFTSSNVQSGPASPSSQSDARSRAGSTVSLLGRSTEGHHEAIVGLAVGTERLSYAQSVLEEKVREVEDFTKVLIGKIGGSERILDRGNAFETIKTLNETKPSAEAAEEPPGMIVKGLLGLEESASGRGTRKLLEVVGLWGHWLEYLKRRITRYF
ncbi:hypothetical protein P389DRAFT_208263 [Cystobasidium minutum MCA 4210]|uniref:uncharacterized protein n=1 Tax=Cystobasidium minutum MCA 4210 TaxID=1397322 RepID=UPI0034CD5E5C|eukprot:jgi/Rhomi1/208263/estExt_Genemark1.C_1_t30299